MPGALGATSKVPKARGERGNDNYRDHVQQQLVGLWKPLIGLFTCRSTVSEREVVVKPRRVAKLDVDDEIYAFYDPYHNEK
eukprot:766227-Hanusia_phi.AAC.2